MKALALGPLLSLLADIHLIMEIQDGQRGLRVQIGWQVDLVTLDGVGWMLSLPVHGGPVEMVLHHLDHGVLHVDLLRSKMCGEVLFKLIGQFCQNVCVSDFHAVDLDIGELHILDVVADILVGDAVQHEKCLDLQLLRLNRGDLMGSVGLIQINLVFFPVLLEDSWFLLLDLLLFYFLLLLLLLSFGLLLNFHLLGFLLLGGDLLVGLLSLSDDRSLPLNLSSHFDMSSQAGEKINLLLLDFLLFFLFLLISFGLLLNFHLLSLLLLGDELLVGLLSLSDDRSLRLDLSSHFEMSSQGSGRENMHV